MAVKPGQLRPWWARNSKTNAPNHEAWRGSARQRGYDTRWDKARKGYLSKHPLCVCCQANGVLVPSHIVDHIIPHKGDMKLFWDSDNWQPLCDWCDKNIKRSTENAWLRGRATQAELSLSRIAEGWEPPSER